MQRTSDIAEIRAIQDAIARPKAPVIGRTFGNAGTAMSYGKVTGVDQNPDLATTTTRILAFRLMRMTDPKVRQGWAARKATALSGTRTIEAQGDTQMHLDGARLCAEVCGLKTPGESTIWAPLMGESFDAVLRRQLNAEYDGFRYQEKVWGVVYSNALGRPVTVPTRIADRDPASHYEWAYCPQDPSVLLGARQRMVSGQPEPHVIPMSSLLYTAYDVDGSNYDGIGLARAAWWVTKAKASVLDSLVVAADVWSKPNNKVVGDQKLALEYNVEAEEYHQQHDALIYQAEAMHSQEQSTLATTPYLELEVHGAGVLDVSSPVTAVNLFDEQVQAVFGTAGLNLGVGESGARNVGEVHDAAFLRSILDMLDAIVDTFGILFAEIMRYNFGPEFEAYAPKLVFSGLNVSVLAQLLPMLPQLIQADAANRAAGGEGILDPETTKVFSQYMRDIVGTRGGSSR